MIKRVFLIVIDSLGIGELPDAQKFGDAGSNTLGAIRKSSKLNIPNLKKLGLFNVDGVGGGVESPTASFARMAEKSAGKDTTVGHWEIMGLISNSPLPTFPDGFPSEITDEFTRKIGRGILCNKPYSGTEVIRDYGKEHVESGKPIVYTSADSVFQIASHTDIIPLEKLYEYCEIARGILVGEYGVGRVIARPFAGDYPFYRTPDRHDYSITPPKQTAVDILQSLGLDTISVGKIYDIFNGRGFSASYPTKSNNEGMDITLQLADSNFEGLCFVNLVEFDSVYGHRNDIDGYASALSEFDRQLKKLISRLTESDVLIVTADHGCDPSTPSTDHSREYTPMLIYGNAVKKGINLGTRSTFADIGATVIEIFGAEKHETDGESFWKEVRL